MTQKRLKPNLFKFIFPITLCMGWFCTAYALPKQPALYDYTGLYKIRESDPNIAGQGVRFMEICRSQTYQNCLGQNDYLPCFDHYCLNESNFWFGRIEPSTVSPYSEHETAIASLLVGSDISAHHEAIGEFEYEAAAPKAELFACEFMEFLTDYIFFNEIPDSTDIVTMSIGTAIPDWWTRGIDALAQNGMIIVAGIGNGGDVFDPVLYPAAGPNIIGVGVVDSVVSSDPQEILSKYWLASRNHSSSGPTDDNRCKPDLVAPGNALVAQSGDISNYSVSGNYSSYSTPVVAGTCGLLKQKIKEQEYYPKLKGQSLINCLVKSILMTSARKPAYWHKGEPGKDDDNLVPLDYLHGSGILDAYASWELLNSGRYNPNTLSAKSWDFDSLNGFEEKTYPVSIIDTEDDHLTATLAWNKNFDSKYPFTAQSDKDIDLRLELWGFDLENNSSAELLDFSDSVNDNIEHIYFPLDGKYSSYEIIIVFSDRESMEKSDRKQNFAISWTTSKTKQEDAIFWYDLNGDCEVNDQDLALLLNKISNPTHKDKESIKGDINQDGKLDLQDALKLRLFFTNLPQN